MITGEPITNDGEPEGVGQDCALVILRDDALEEVVSFAPEPAGGAGTPSALANDKDDRRQARRNGPIFVPAKIDLVHIDSRYGEGLFESGLLNRLIPRPDLLDEEGVRQFCRQLPIHVISVDKGFDAFGGVISYELAVHGLRTSREIPVLMYESVSKEDKLHFAIFDQLLLRALVTENDQISGSFLADLLQARSVCPSLFRKVSKEGFVTSFGFSSRTFRSPSTGPGKKRAR